MPKVQGHKAAGCLAKPRCYQCKEEGHFARDCCKKDLETDLFVVMAVCQPIKVKVEEDHISQEEFIRFSTLDEKGLEEIQEEVGDPVGYPTIH